MKLRSLFENYNENQRLIILCDREIALRRLSLSPTYISQLSLAPGRPSGNTSQVERTVMRIDADTDIKYWEKKKEQLNLDVETVHKMLRYMDEETREVFQLRFFCNMSVSDIAEKYGYTERTVYRMISDTIECLAKRINE